MTAVLVTAAVVALPAPPASADMCSPTTLSDLFPAEPPPSEEAGDDDPMVEAAPAPESETWCSPYRRRIHSPLPFWIPAGSSFGADRDGGARHHAGNDIAANRLTPILAVADGRVSRIGRDNTSIRITHSDGWSSSYVHLNNDTWGTDDGAVTTGILPGLELGDRVVAGQVIGYVGDSTNAEGTIPHLHWELRTPGGTPIDPWASYKAASGRQDPFAGPFRDDDGHAAEPFINLATSLGAVLACDELGFDVCTDEPLSPDRAEWLVEVLTGFAITVPTPDLAMQAHVDVTGRTLPTSPAPEKPTAPPSADGFADMLESAAELRAASDRLAAVLTSSTTTTEEPTYLQSVGCLWQAPSGEEAITTAEAIVMALVETGWVGRPSCDFTPTTTTSP